MKKNAKNNAVNTANKNESIVINNAHVTAMKNDKGFIVLYLGIANDNGAIRVPIMVKGFKDTKWSTLRKQTYKIYELLGGK